MEPIELRPMNIVYHDYVKKPVFVTGIFLDADEIWYCPIDELDEFGEIEKSYRGPIQSLHGITLAEEWILKVKYKKDDIGENRYIDEKGLMIEFNNGLVEWVDNYTTIYHQEIKYVHQLQNLYFSIIGEELKLISQNV